MATEADVGVVEEHREVVHEVVEVLAEARVVVVEVLKVDQRRSL